MKEPHSSAADSSIVSIIIIGDIVDQAIVIIVIVNYCDRHVPSIVILNISLPRLAG